MTSEQTASKEATRKAMAMAIVQQMSKASDNMKKSLPDAKNGKYHEMSMHIADAIVNLVEVGDMVDKNMMAMVFKRLGQIDRMQG